MITGGRVIIDEAGIEYNNRDFKDFSKKSLYFYKYHRHYQLAIDVFSQGFDDMDKKIRTLAQKLYVVKKGLLPWFIHRRQIKKRVGINDMSKEIIDEYYFVPWSTKNHFLAAALEDVQHDFTRRISAKAMEKMVKSTRAQHMRARVLSYTYS